MAKDEKLTFEEALEELESIVSKLEQEDVPLDKLIEYYQNGMQLVKKSRQMLDDAEEKMAQVLSDDGQLEAFTIEEEEKEQ